MTLDEAIEHASEVADGCGECAEDHAQLDDWLRELRRARMEIDLLKTLRDGFKADAQKYKTENDRLRELLKELYYCSRQIGCDQCRYRRSFNGKLCETLDELRELGIEG